MKNSLRFSFLFALLFGATLAGSKAQMCQASFTASGDPTVQFTNTSGGLNVLVTSWGIWSFGDGSTGTTVGMNGISHTYSNNGVYYVCLTIGDSTGCSDTYCDSVLITNAGGGGGGTCNAAFTYSVDTCDVTFTDGSTAQAGVVGWQWSFGDGTGSNLQNPTHTYSGTGPYTVTLTSIAADSCISSVSYTVNTPLCNGGGQPCNVTYNWVHDSTFAFTVLVFPNYQGGPATNYLWDFGDGTTSTLAYPTHTYAGAGYYNVCVTITDFNCTSTFCDTLGVLYKTNTPFTINIVNTTTGIKDPVVPTEMSVYPNPFNEELNINIPADLNGTSEIQLIDLSGKTVFHSQTSSTGGNFTAKVNPGKLNAGIYLLKVSNGAQVFVKRVVVN